LDRTRDRIGVAGVVGFGVAQERAHVAQRREAEPATFGSFA
jgi:hypothetical protein